MNLSDYTGEPIKLADLLAQQRHHSSNRSVAISEWLSFRLSKPMHPGGALELANFLSFLVETDLPVFWTGTDGYLQKACKRSPAWVSGFKEVLQYGLVYKHKVHGGYTLHSTSKLRNLSNQLGEIL